MAQQMNTAEQVALRVGTLIKESGVTHTWLCERTGIPRTTLHRRLNGHSAFDLNELDAIAEALRVSVEVFLAAEAVA